MKPGTFVSQDFTGRFIAVVENDPSEPWVSYMICCRTDGSKYIRKFYMNKPVGKLYRLPRNWGGAYWADLVV